MNRLLIVFLALVLFIRCDDDEKIVVKEKEPNWKTHSNFYYENAVQTNSLSAGEQMFFFGLYKFSTFGINSPISVSSDPVTGVPIANYYHWVSDQPTLNRFPISPNFFIEYQVYSDFATDADQLWFVSSVNPTNANTAIHFGIKDIDPSFIEFKFLPLSRDECIAINDNNQALIPYYGLTEGVSRLKLALVDIETSGDPVYVDTVRTKTFSLPDESQVSTLYIQHIGSDFMLTTDSKTYRIDQDGEIAQTYNYHLYDIIPTEDSIFAVAYNFQAARYEWSYSINNGLSWVGVVEIPSDYESLNFSVINDRIVGFHNSQLWEIKRKPNGIESVELDNDGLDGKFITSIAGYKEHVFVSSLSGVFHKTMDEFFAPKEEKP